MVENHEEPNETGIQVATNVFVYDTDINHVEGEENVDADPLCRAPVKH